MSTITKQSRYGEHFDGNRKNLDLLNADGMDNFDSNAEIQFNADATPASATVRVSKKPVQTKVSDAAKTDTSTDASTDKTADTSKVVAPAPKADEKEFYKSPMYWGIVAVVGIGGFVFAKMKSKNKLYFTLGGLVAGGALGFGVHKFTNKKEKVSSADGDDDDSNATGSTPKVVQAAKCPEGSYYTNGNCLNVHNGSLVKGNV